MVGDLEKFVWRTVVGDLEKFIWRTVVGDFVLELVMEYRSAWRPFVEIKT